MSGLTRRDAACFLSKTHHVRPLPCLPALALAAACSPLTPDAAFVGWQLELVTAVLVPPAAAAAPGGALAPAPAVTPASPLSAIESPLGSETGAAATAFTSAASLAPKAAASVRDLRAAMIAELYKSARQAEAEAEGDTAMQPVQSVGTAMDAGFVVAAEDLVSPSAAAAAPDVGPLPDDGAAAVTARRTTTTHSEEAVIPSLSLRFAADTALPGPSYAAAPPLPPPPLLLSSPAVERGGNGEGDAVRGHSPLTVVALPRVSASPSGDEGPGSSLAVHVSEVSLSARPPLEPGGDELHADTLPLPSPRLGASAHPAPGQATDLETEAAAPVSGQAPSPSPSLPEA